MTKRPETASEWLDYYEAKYEKAYNNYQQSGVAKYDNEANRLSVIVDAFTALVNKQNARHDENTRRAEACAYVVDNLRKECYSRPEVVSMLQSAIHW